MKTKKFVWFFTETILSTATTRHQVKDSRFVGESFFSSSVSSTIFNKNRQTWHMKHDIWKESEWEKLFIENRLIERKWSMSISTHSLTLYIQFNSYLTTTITIIIIDINKITRKNHGKKPWTTLNLSNKPYTHTINERSKKKQDTPERKQERERERDRENAEVYNWL